MKDVHRQLPHSQLPDFHRKESQDGRLRYIQTWSLRSTAFPTDQPYPSDSGYLPLQRVEQSTRSIIQPSTMGRHVRLAAYPSSSVGEPCPSSPLALMPMPIFMPMTMPNTQSSKPFQRSISPKPTFSTGDRLLANYNLVIKVLSPANDSKDQVR
ncbi:hypothetical protein BS50DRAFT_572127 [Corynespora cassiicola Philippines]|uniref:Uncharacterized protein n=1 Tax=Corynespora cassiicola Philippines TaxID=1448308 RepID=A0A2T2NU80_CORCC|nr:hypothetical protein BS50DRAFT_572127 [Corynespora cassiicola Philippines]